MQAQTLHLGRIGANALLRRRILGGNLRQQKSSTNNNLLGGYSRHAFCGRSFSSSSSSDLPYHIVMGLPALSPTMESGALAEWYVKEGDRFAAGDAVAKIETDKASIDFEAQDDGFVAKILATAGDGQDIAIGTPIMISVEEEEHVAALLLLRPPPPRPLQLQRLLLLPKQQQRHRSLRWHHLPSLRLRLHRRRHRLLLRLLH
jgi:Biotin-requiring enzyme